MILRIITWMSLVTLTACGGSPTADRHAKETRLEQSAGSAPERSARFRRIASFEIHRNTAIDLETAAEILTSADDGKRLIYADSTTGNIGFVDLEDPHDPKPLGVLAVGGEPTSVAAHGAWALACVNRSSSYTKPSGTLEVIDHAARKLVRSLELGGQPDSIAVSPDGRYAVIAIENERDEELGDGEPPQEPPGFLVIVDLVGDPQGWSTRNVELTGLAQRFPQDPEPEYVDINASNVAVVTLQENNHLVLVDLASGRILSHASAGTVELTEVDVLENHAIEQTAALSKQRREPDAVTWIGGGAFATADEGDLGGGGRGFTIWSEPGIARFEAGSRVEHVAARIGHYDDERSEDRGSEPEAVEYARFGGRGHLFVGSERCNLVLVYDVGTKGEGRQVNFLQALPSGPGPESLHAIAERDLLVVSCEVDDREAGVRSTIQIYQYGAQPNYPTITSLDRASGVPIPWGALSALAPDPEAPDRIHSAPDRTFRRSRILSLDVSGSGPARVIRELFLRDGDGVLHRTLHSLVEALPDAEHFDPARLFEEDGAVHLDIEGLTALPDGGFWAAVEGRGDLKDGADDPGGRPFECPNLLVRCNASGVITEVVTLPLELQRNQRHFGFEGLARVQDALVVAFQRPWRAAGDPPDRARIGCYDTSSGSWTFAHYRLESAAGVTRDGWVGLSALAHVGGDRLGVLERDNQAGSEARHKRLASFRLGDAEFLPQRAAPHLPLLKGAPVLDLLEAQTFAPYGGSVPGKLEGLAVLEDGTALLVNDNLDEVVRETLLVRIPGLF